MRPLTAILLTLGACRRAAVVRSAVGARGQLRWHCRRSTSCSKSIRAADKGQLAVSEEDGRFLRVLIASTGAKTRARDRRRERLQRDLDGPGPARSGRPARRRSSTTRRARAKPPTTSAAPGCRTSCRSIAGDAFKEIPKLHGHVRPRVPRCVEARLQEILRSRLSAGHARRPVPRAQRHQQEKRDAGFPRR